MGCRNADDTHAGGESGSNAGVRILKHDAGLWINAKTGGGFQVDIGSRLGERNFVAIRFEAYVLAQVGFVEDEIQVQTNKLYWQESP